MQQIIDGVKYDTEADDAHRVAKHQNMYDSGDFSWYKEELYRTDSGRWFLFGKGNAQSKYRETVGTREWSSGKEIKAFSEDEAYDWLEAHNEVGAIEEHFSGRVEPA
jgi:hypothetical protein